MKHNKDRIRFLVSIVFSFVLTLIFFVVFLVLGLNFGFFNNRVILNKVSESNYYNKVYETLNEQCEEMMIANGLPASMLEDVITLERVYVSGRNYIEHTLQGKRKEIQTDKMEEDLEQKLLSYLSEEGIEPTEEVYQGILEMISLIKVQYQRNIEFKFVYYLSVFRSSVFQSICWIFTVIVIFAGIIIGLLLVMFPYIHRGLRFVQYALMASSSITLLLSTYLLLFNGFDKLKLDPFFYENFMTSYLKGSIQVYLYIGGMGLLLSFMLMALIRYLRSNSIKSNK